MGVVRVSVFIKRLPISLIIAFLFTSVHAMEVEGLEANSSSRKYSVYRSAEELPKKFQISAPKIRELNYVDFDTLEFSASRGSVFYEAWDPKKLENNGYTFVQALSFLNFSSDQFANHSRGFYNLSSGLPKEEELYFGAYWNHYNHCASLISPSHPSVQGTYGFVLEIPPQLIFRLYPEDATTSMNSTWLDEPRGYLQEYENFE